MLAIIIIDIIVIILVFWHLLNIVLYSHFSIHFMSSQLTYKFLEILKEIRVPIIQSQR